MSIDPDRPHRYQPWPIPNRWGEDTREGSVGFWRRFNQMDVRRDVDGVNRQRRVDAPVPCAAAGCGASPMAPVHFDVLWRSPAEREDGA